MNSGVINYPSDNPSFTRRKSYFLEISQEIYILQVLAWMDAQDHRLKF